MTWTISALLDWTTLYFKKHNIESPHLEAEILLSHALKLKRIDLYVQHERVLKEEELAAFKKHMLRRVKGEPTAYIIGFKPFMSLDLIVTKDVLIPRPETEKLVEIALDTVKALGRPADVLDIGTGSGAIAVSIAKYANNCTVIGVDTSAEALNIAEQNANNLELTRNTSFILSDVFSAFTNEKKFDLIVSNPPYIPTKEIENLQPEIRDHEPVKALDGGTDGLDFYRAIVPRSPDFLIPGGNILLEVGMGQAQAVADMFKAIEVFGDVKVYKDYSDIERIVSAKLK